MAHTDRADAETTHGCQSSNIAATGIPSRLFVLALAIGAVLMLGLELGRMDVWSDTEGSRVTPPVEMLRSGDFIVPSINGVPYLNKPPLLYWAIAATYALTGTVSAFTARIPAVLCGLGLVFGVYLFLRRAGQERAGRWAAVAVLASPYILKEARSAELDVPLAFAVLLAVLALRAACRAEARAKSLSWMAGGGLALGAAFLLKGPPALLFVWAAWLALCLEAGPAQPATLRLGLLWTAAALGIETLSFGVESVRGEPVGAPLGMLVAGGAWSFLAFRTARGAGLRCLGLFAGALCIGVLVALPWGLAVVSRLGWTEIQELLHREVIERTYSASAINSGSPFKYVLMLPVLCLPWGLLFPLQASPTQWRRQPEVYRFAVGTGWLSVLLFSMIAGKEYKYILPAMPFLLMGAGLHLAAPGAFEAAEWTARWRRCWRALLLALCPVLAVAAAAYVAVEPNPAILRAEVWALSAVALAAGGFALRRPAWRNRCLAVLVMSVLLTGILVRTFYYTGDRSGREMAERTGELVRAGYQVEAHFIRFFPHFAFYAQTEIPVQLDLAAVRENLFGDAPYYCAIREGEYQGLLLYPEPVPVEVLMGPHTPRRLLLIGNAPLPEL